MDSDSLWLRLARRIRHAPGLRGLDGVWRGLRPAYHRVLERLHGSRGIPVSLGAAGRMHVPASFVHNSVDPLELPMLARLRGHVRADTCFYDIGASIGLHSLAVGELLGPGGAIHAFEPDPASARQYWANTRLLRARGVPLELQGCFVADRTRDYDRTRVRHTGAEPDAPGEATQHLYLADPAHAAAHAAVTLDDYVAGGARPPTLLKCDIEGAEGLFLRGAARVLRAHRPVLFLSVHPLQLPAFGESAADVQASVQALGYDWELIDEAGEQHVLAAPR